ncbi:hypothetical protein ABH37_17345 [Mycobacterium haemophilum]|uniref:Uncharacterized protein n=1 Tax=Mycobacterium haemophilum TaxID=29311 RepID=A0A0I9TBQ9_9MYCO|nr:hypothetical protein ABH39_16800 [Mycobacterium haemophilum]KLO34855.1 hypothetical protein ABH38_17525 [Mycobacterium haemophilum]KLO39837.1 hypothetical protein ABH37_17345 [Mycobacterium haemophilum]KLO46877.1 hypothetical protein ABH36_17455 [Mycobacterium haemophilum]
MVVDGEIVDAEPAVERAASLWGIDPVGMPAGGQFGAEFAGSLGSVSQDGQRMRFFSKQFQPDGRFRHLAAHPPDRADQLGHGVLGATASSSTVESKAPRVLAARTPVTATTALTVSKIRLGRSEAANRRRQPQAA